MKVNPTQSQVRYGGWSVICEGEGLRDGRAVQVLNFKNEQGEGRLITTVLRRVREGVLMILELPFGVDLRPGIAVQFDANEEFKLPFTTCYASGCQVLTILSEEHVNQFSNSTMMKVGFRPFAQEQVFVVEVPLEGGGDALAAVPEPIFTAQEVTQDAHSQQDSLPPAEDAEVVSEEAASGADKKAAADTAKGAKSR